MLKAIFAVSSAQLPLLEAITTAAITGCKVIHAQGAEKGSFVVRLGACVAGQGMVKKSMSVSAS